MAIFNSYSDITRGYQLEHEKKHQTFSNPIELDFVGAARHL